MVLTLPLKLGISALVIAGVSLLAFLILLILVVLRILPSERTACSLVEDLPDTEDADTILIPARTATGCAKVAIPYDTFMSRFFLRSCAYRAPDNKDGVEANNDMWPLEWEVRSLIVNGKEFLETKFTDATGGPYNSYDGSVAPGLNLYGEADTNKTYPAFMVFLNACFSFAKLDVTHNFLATAAPANLTFSGGGPFVGAFKIETAMGLEFDMTVYLNTFGGIIYHYRHDGMYLEGGGMENYHGHCTVRSIFPLSVREGLPDAGNRECFAMNDPVSRDPTPLDREGRLNSWEEASPLLKERVACVRKVVAEEHKLDPNELKIWLHGSQLHGHSRTGEPDIDLRVYHPSFKGRRFTHEERMALKAKFEFKADVVLTGRPVHEQFMLVS